MGIPGLLVALKSYLSTSTSPPLTTATATNVSFPTGRNSHHPNHNTRQNHDPLYPYNGNIYTDFHDQAVAIDASSWFHKSVYSIADHYVECIEKLNLTSSNGGTTGSNYNHHHYTSVKLDAKCIATSKKYMIERCTELLSNPHRNGVSKIYLVMDGERCPLKSVTSQERTDKRTKALDMARKYKVQGQKDKMHEQYRSCIKVVNALSYTVARQVEQHFASILDPRVEIVWSPYEADAQLVQLCGIERRCSAIITEDSDVLVYCAACNVSIPIIYKLDRTTGYCSTMSMDWLIHPTTFRNERFISNTKNALVDARQSTKVSTIDAIFDILVGRQIQHPGWGTRLFVQGCVLAGCDYSPRGQIPGVGLVNAFKYVQMAGSSSNHQQLDTIFDRILTTYIPMKSRRLILNAIPILKIQLSQSEAVFYYHPVLKSNSHSVTVQYLNEISTIEDDVIVHRPSLRRYENDLSFLGSLSMNRTMGDSGIIPKNMMQQNMANRKRKSTDSNQKHDRRPTKSILVPFCNATNTIQISDDISPLSSSTHLFARPSTVVQNENKRPPTSKQNHIPSKPIINPYNQQHKKESRPPLQSLNPFEVYARRHREVGIQESHRIVTAKLPVRSNMIVNTKSTREEDKHKDIFHCPQPPFPNQKLMLSTSVNRKHNVNDVRFVKRTDYGILDKHDHRPYISRHESMAIHPLLTSSYMTRNEKSTEHHKTIFEDDLVMNRRMLPRPTHSPKAAVKSKFFSGQSKESTSKGLLFEIKEECPSLPQSELDVVSLIGFDQYESQPLLSPDKSPTLLRNSFEYDMAKESPNDNISTFESHNFPLVHGQVPYGNGTLGNENIGQPNCTFANRRVTLELPKDEILEYMRPDRKSSHHEIVPIQYNVYDSVPCPSPINDIVIDDEYIDITVNAHQNTDGILEKRVQAIGTIKYRLGSVISTKASKKKLVKRSNVIQRVLQNHRKRSIHRSTTREPGQTTLLSHFQSDRSSAT